MSKICHFGGQERERGVCSCVRFLGMNRFEGRLRVAFYWRVRRGERRVESYVEVFKNGALMYEMGNSLDFEL